MAKTGLSYWMREVATIAFSLFLSLSSSYLIIIICFANPSTDAKKQAAYCENLAKTIKSISDLPDKCKDYDAVKAVLQKRKTVTDPFAGMQGSVAARANRTAGVESHAKIQRRMTSGATVGARRFSKLDK